MMKEGVEVRWVGRTKKGKRGEEERKRGEEVGTEGWRNEARGGERRRK